MPWPKGKPFPPEMVAKRIESFKAAGADLHGEDWARRRGITVTRFPADWQTYGRAAGPIRNRQMADYATHAVVVWNGVSRGSASMVQIARERRLPLSVYSP